MSVGGNAEFVEWKELDDGRIGRIELRTDVVHVWPHDREQGIAPLPEVVVRATQIKYDDYHQDFKESYHRAKAYSDPVEAFEVFLALAVENAKVPQYDVRQQNGDFRRRGGTSQPKIYDGGEFKMHLLEDGMG